MAFAIPSVKDMVLRARNAFRAELPGTDAFVWPNNITVSAKVIGGAVWELFGRLKWMDRQRFAMTADGYELERHGLDYGIGRKPASYAQGNLMLIAESYPLVVPSGTTFVRTDGVSFTSNRTVEVGKFTLTASVPVVADTPGKNGNTLDGAPMSTALAGVASVTVDGTGLGQGADTETDDQLRTRILNRKRYPPHGGAVYDYVGWGLAQPGVTRVFPSGNVYGRGTVGVWFLMDDTYPNGIPQPADVAAMQAYLDSVAPITATVIVQAPIADCIDIVIGDLNPDTQAVREAVAAELATLFRNMTQPGLPGEEFVIPQSWLWQAVSNATGEISHKIVAPATDLTFGAGIMPCLRSVTFTKTPT